MLFVFAIAKFLSQRSEKQYDYKFIFGIFLLTGIVFLLVLQQPDLGTSLVFGGILLVMLYWAGMPSEWALIVLSAIITIIFSARFDIRRINASF